MSRVTLGRVWSELCDMPTPNFDKVNHIEIVPRKMVEMIIEKCKEVQYITNNDDELVERGKWSASDEIKEYVESLLKQFEEEGE